MNTISVIIPTWNRAKFLKRAISSVLEQTYPVSEILVCDDGSTDNSKATVKKINHRYPTVKWVEGGHTGLPAVARNRGLKLARGEWIAFLDSDDAWLPDKLSKQILAMRNDHCFASCSNALRLIPRKVNHKSLLSWPKLKVTFTDLIEQNPIVCSSVVIHRNIMNKVGYFFEDRNLRAIEDYQLWLRVSIFTDFAYISSSLLSYTDDAMNSIRKDTSDLDVWSQREHVFGGFSWWAINNGIFDRHLTNSVREYLYAKARSTTRTIKNRFKL